MAHSALISFKGGPITAMDAQQGTLIFLAYGESNSTVVQYTIAGGTTAIVAKFGERIQALINDATYLWIAMGNRLMKYTIADGTWVEVERYACAIVSLSKYSSKVYVGLENGDFSNF